MNINVLVFFLNDMLVDITAESHKNIKVTIDISLYMLVTCAFD